MIFDRRRRALLVSVLAIGVLGRRADGQSAAERLVAAMQDGGKIIYLRCWGLDPRSQRGGQTPPAPTHELGRALYALRVPLNEILASPAPQARRTAEAAFGTERLREAKELAPAERADGLQALRQLLRTIPGPGMNRVLVGERGPLESAAGRRFSDAVLPEGAMAVFLPGDTLQMLGTITAERVIASAKARGAL